MLTTLILFDSATLVANVEYSLTDVVLFKLGSFCKVILGRFVSSNRLRELAFIFLYFSMYSFLQHSIFDFFYPHILSFIS
jgi:hypothetical protein